MFTSRAEYRLSLREDNARDRLFKYAERLGLVDLKYIRHFEKVKLSTLNEIEHLRGVHIPISKLDGLAERFVKRDAISLAELLKVPGVGYEDIEPYIPNDDGFSESREIRERAAIRIRYEGYIARQEREVAKFRKMEKETIPPEMEFANLAGLRNEAREKLTRFRPESLGQAGRIEGITTGDLSALSVHVQKFKRTHGAHPEA